MKTKIIRRILAAIVAAATFTSISGVVSAGGMGNNKFLGHKRPRDNSDDDDNANNNINNNNNDSDDDDNDNNNEANEEDEEEVEEVEYGGNFDHNEFVEEFFEKYENDDIEENVNKLRECATQKDLRGKVAKIFNELLRGDLLKSLKMSSLIAIIESLGIRANEDELAVKLEVAEFVEKITSSEINVGDKNDVDSYVNYILKSLNACLHGVNNTYINAFAARAILNLSEKPLYCKSLDISSTMSILYRCASGKGFFVKKVVVKAMRALTSGQKIDSAFKDHTLEMLKVLDKCSEDKSIRVATAVVILRMHESGFLDENNMQAAVKVLSKCWGIKAEEIGL